MNKPLPEPGWVIISRNGLWHYRHADGMVQCMKSQGKKDHLLEWRKEPNGKYDICPTCARWKHDQDQERFRKEAEAIIPPSQKESEKNPVEKRVKIKEAADLVGRSYATVHHWVTKEDSLLHYDEETKDMPYSDLDIIEQLSQAGRRKHVPSVPIPEIPTSAGKTPASSSQEFNLPPKHKFIAELIGKTEVEYMEYALNLAYEELKRKLK